MTKLSEKQFWAVLTSCGGFYSKTAKKIEKELGIKISRQAVYDRANKKPERLKQIEEEIVEVSEDVLQSIIRNPNTDKRTRLDAVKFVLKSKGKDRGYGQENESINVTIPFFKIVKS